MSVDPKLYDKLSAYCAYSERCTKDVLEKCKKLAIEAETIPAYLSKLEQQGFLNDMRYAKSFITSKVNRKWGFSKIQSALIAKRINSEIFMPFFEEIGNEVLIENIQLLAARKLKTIKGETPQEIKQKLIRFLMSKGYSYDLIKKALNQT